MKLGPLCEIILSVRDMAAQVSFYRDVLGLPVKFPGDITDYSAEHWVTFETGGCTLALHGGGTGQFGEDAPKFVFRVCNLEATHSELLAKGVRLGPERFPLQAYVFVTVAIRRAIGFRWKHPELHRSLRTFSQRLIRGINTGAAVAS